jgi:hypothetical protein
MIALVQLLMLPLIVLNMLGGIVAMVWLAILGQWHMLGIGLALLFGTTFALGFALMPQMLLAAPAVLLYEKGQKALGFFFGGLALLYVYALVTAWCGAVLWYSMERVTTANLLIPILLWSYGVATGPWAFMASKEDNIGSAFTVFFSRVGYIIMGLMILFGYPSFYDVMKMFIAVMLVGLFASLIFVGISSRQSRVSA